MTRLLPILLALPLLGADDPPKAAPLLTVGGGGEHPLKLTADDLAAMPRQSIRAKDHKGVESTWEGVPLAEVLERAGAPQGERLRGAAMADVLVVEASDGYRAAFALPEVDPTFNDRAILLADRRDGRPLPVPEGPLRLVVPGEKKHARWVRQVNRLTIARAPTLPAESASR